MTLTYDAPGVLYDDPRFFYDDARSASPKLAATHFAFDDFPSSGTALVNAFERSFVANLYDSGAFTVTGHWTDSDFQAIAPGDLIAFDALDSLDSPFRAFAGIVRRITYDRLAPGEGKDQIITVEGEGHLSILTDGLIEPPGGEGRFPTVDDFYFDYTHIDYDDSAWSNAVELISVEDAKVSWPVLWADDMPAHAIAGPGSGTTMVVGPSSGSTTAAPVGDCYLRDYFTTSYDGVHLVFFTVDNTGEFWIDGKQICSSGTNGNPLESGFVSATQVAVSLSAGTHVVAIRATNWPLFAAPSPIGAAGAIYVPGYPPTLVWESTGAMLIEEYPAETPGMTAGTDLRLMIEAQQNLGRWGYLDLDCTDDDDANSDAWADMPTLSVKVGSDTVYSAALKLVTLYCDLVMDPSDWILHAYNKDAAGGTSGVDLEVGNLTLLRYKREDITSDELLIRSEIGWSRNGSSGRREGYLELGSENNPDEVTRVSDRVLGVYNSPREEVEVAYLPLDDTEIPWVNSDFVPGSTVTVPTRTGGTTTDRALSIGMTYANDVLSITLKVQDVVISNQERIIEMLKLR